MQKIITPIIIAIIAVAVSSCGGGNSNPSQQNDSTQIEQRKQDSIRKVQAEAERIKKEKEEQERLEEEKRKADSINSQSSEQSPESQSDAQAKAEKYRENEITLQLLQLGQQYREKMPEIARLYARQQQAQRNGLLSNPSAQFDLNDAIGELVDIKNKQIELARELGDEQLVKEYKQQRDEIYEAKDRMLYGM